MSYKQDDVDVPVSVFLELFLTRKEKDVFSTWNEQERDLSISGFIIGPITNWIAKFVPNSVAPNVLTIAGVLAIMQAWWFCEEFSDDHPRIVAAASVLSIIVFWVLGRVDGKHARRIMNDTPLGELFKYVTDTIGMWGKTDVKQPLCYSSTRFVWHGHPLAMRLRSNSSSDQKNETETGLGGINRKGMHPLAVFPRGRLATPNDHRQVET